MHKYFELLNENANLIIIKHGKKHFFNDKGVKSLLTILNSDPELLKDALVIDSVVGKAAASLFTKGKVAKIYARLISKNATKFLDENNMIYEFINETDYIINRSKTDYCPMEKATLNLKTCDECYDAIRKKAKEMNINF